jgi:hypothetical protein
MMTRLQPMFERVDEAELLLRAEIAADALPDHDVDRVYVFDLVLHRIVLISKQGPALDPYAAADLGHLLDAIGMLIPLTALKAGDLCARITIFSDVMRDREFKMTPEFVKYDGDKETGERSPGNATLTAKMREVLGPVLPRGKSSETRVICARIVRRQMVGGLALRRVTETKKEGEEA